MYHHQGMQPMAIRTRKEVLFLQGTVATLLTIIAKANTTLTAKVEQHLHTTDMPMEHRHRKGILVQMPIHHNHSSPPVVHLTDCHHHTMLTHIHTLGTSLGRNDPVLRKTQYRPYARKA
jgi:hypothetical protein